MYKIKHSIDEMRDWLNTDEQLQYLVDCYIRGCGITVSDTLKLEAPADFIPIDFGFVQSTLEPVAVQAAHDYRTFELKPGSRIGVDPIPLTPSSLPVTWSEPISEADEPLVDVHQETARAVMAKKRWPVASNGLSFIPKPGEPWFVTPQEELTEALLDLNTSHPHAQSIWRDLRTRRALGLSSQKTMTALQWPPFSFTYQQALNKLMALEVLEASLPSDPTERELWKHIRFARSYGMKWDTLERCLSEAPHKFTLEQAKAILDDFKKAYPALTEYTNFEKRVERNNRVTMSGRIPSDRPNDPMRPREADTLRARFIQSCMGVVSEWPKTQNSSRHISGFAMSADYGSIEKSIVRKEWTMPKIQNTARLYDSRTLAQAEAILRRTLGPCRIELLHERVGGGVLVSNGGAFNYTNTPIQTWHGVSLDAVHMEVVSDRNNSDTEQQQGVTTMSESQLLQFFRWEHLKDEKLQAVSKQFHALVVRLLDPSLVGSIEEGCSVIMRFRESLVLYVPHNLESDMARTKLSEAAEELCEGCEVDDWVRLILEAKDCAVRSLLFKPC